MPLTDDGAPDGWLGFLAPAAALWLAAAMFATAGGRADRWRHSASMPHGPIRIAVAVLSAVLVAGLANRLIRPWLAELWLGRRLERFLQYRTNRRRKRWDDAQDKATSGETAEGRLEQAAIRNRIALARPVCPTWMGDRVAALETRVHNEYELDFPAAWPRLWLVIPEPSRAELRAAILAWHRSTAWGAWALLYAALVAVAAVAATNWLPLLALAVLTFATALRSAHRAIAQLTDLAESAVDLYGVDLAEQLGIEVPERQVTLDIGREITVRLRKSG